MTVVTTDVLKTRPLKVWQFISGSSLVLLAGFTLRWTALDRMALVTGDQRTFLTYTAIILNDGLSGISGGYAFSPLLMIEQAVIHLITGETIIRSIVGTTVISALLPLLIGGALYAETANRRLCFTGIVLSAPFVLFLRRSALVRPEVIVLAWFGTILLLLIIELSRSEKRARLLLALLVGTVILVHPFYPVAFTIIFGAATITAFSINYAKPHTPIANYRNLLILTLIVGSLATVRAFWTPTSSYAVLIMTSAEIPSATDIVTNLIAPPDQIGAGLGGSGESSNSGKPFISVIRFGQIAMLLGLAGLSVLLNMVDKKKKWIHLMIISGAILLLGVFATIGSFHSNVGFRTYYFVGIALLLLGSMTVIHISDDDTVSSLLHNYQIPVTENMLLFLIVAYVFVFWIAGPISSLGNGIDPIPYGERLAWSHQEYTQWTQLADLLMEDYNPYTPSIDSMSIHRYADLSGCESSNKLWDSGDIFACSDTNR